MGIKLKCNFQPTQTHARAHAHSRRSQVRTWIRIRFPGAQTELIASRWLGWWLAPFPPEPGGPGLDSGLRNSRGLSFNSPKTCTQAWLKTLNCSLVCACVCVPCDAPVTSSRSYYWLPPGDPESNQKTGKGWMDGWFTRSRRFSTQWNHQGVTAKWLFLPDPHKQAGHSASLLLFSCPLVWVSALFQYWTFSGSRTDFFFFYFSLTTQSSSY